MRQSTQDLRALLASAARIASDALCPRAAASTRSWPKRSADTRFTVGRGLFTAACLGMVGELWAVTQSRAVTIPWVTA